MSYVTIYACRCREEHRSNTRSCTSVFAFLFRGTGPDDRPERRYVPDLCPQCHRAAAIRQRHQLVEQQRDRELQKRRAATQRQKREHLDQQRAHQERQARVQAFAEAAHVPQELRVSAIGVAVSAAAAVPPPPPAARPPRTTPSHAPALLTDRLPLSRSQHIIPRKPVGNCTDTDTYTDTDTGTPLVHLAAARTAAARPPPTVVRVQPRSSPVRRPTPARTPSKLHKRSPSGSSASTASTTSSSRPTRSTRSTRSSRSSRATQSQSARSPPNPLPARVLDALMPRHAASDESFVCRDARQLEQRVAAVGRPSRVKSVI